MGPPVVNRSLRGVADLHCFRGRTLAQCDDFPLTRFAASRFGMGFDPSRFFHGISFLAVHPLQRVACGWGWLSQEAWTAIGLREGCQCARRARAFWQQSQSDSMRMN